MCVCVSVCVCVYVSVSQSVCVCACICDVHRTVFNPDPTIAKANTNNVFQNLRKQERCRRNASTVLCLKQNA